MNNLSIIIPSKTAANVNACVAAIRAAGETCRIIVVDDGINWPIVCGENAVALPIEAWPFAVFSGEKPFIFARNINLGIKAAGEDDVILLNDDALLETPGGFTAMQRAAVDNPTVGLVSATTNLAGNPDQHRRKGRTTMRFAGNCPGNSFPHVAYVCVFIPRSTINVVGLLDERFGGTTPAGKRIYGYEDNDYSRRIIRLAGLHIGIHDGCYVDHSRLKPTFRGDPSTMDMEAAHRIYLDKWGRM